MKLSNLLFLFSRVNVRSFRPIFQGNDTDSAPSRFCEILACNYAPDPYTPGPNGFEAKIIWSSILSQICFRPYSWSTVHSNNMLLEHTWLKILLQIIIWLKIWLHIIYGSSWSGQEHKALEHNLGQNLSTALLRKNLGLRGKLYDKK